MDDTIRFKSEQIAVEFFQMPVLLRCIAEDMADVVRDFNKHLIVTRVFEYIKTSSGVHEAKRAFDVRDEFLNGFCFTDSERNLIIEKINNKYERNDGYKTIIWHSFNEGPHHFHVQIAESNMAYYIER